MEANVLGLIVFSKCGRDKGKPFIVTGTQSRRDGEYYLLVDGDLRPLSKPKLKKIRHIQRTNEINVDVQTRLRDGINIQDAEIRKALQPYLKLKKGVTELVKG